MKELAPDTFRKILKSISLKTLKKIFGNKLQPQRRDCAVDEGTGFAFLGWLLPATPIEVFINNWGKVRTNINDGIFDVDLSLPDLRFCEDIKQTPLPKVVSDV